MALRRFSDNPAATTPLGGTETIPALQGGVDVQVTVDDIVNAASGAVTSVNGATGAVVIALDDIDDVDAAAPSDGDVLTWDSGDGEWQAKPASGSGGGSDVLDVETPANVSGTVTLDFDSKSRYVGSITLGANVTTLAFDNLPGAGKFAEYELHITQDGTGSRTFAIPASHKALGGSDTSIAGAANAVTVLTASTVDNGTTWRYAMQESA